MITKTLLYGTILCACITCASISCNSNSQNSQEPARKAVNTAIPGEFKNWILLLSQSQAYYAKNHIWPRTFEELKTFSSKAELDKYASVDFSPQADGSVQIGYTLKSDPGKKHIHKAPVPKLRGK